MPSPSAVFTQVATATNRNWGTEVTDNVSEKNILYNRMKKKGHIKSKSGGEFITLPLEYAENATLQNYSGYDPLNTGQSDVLTTARFDWMQKAMHISSNGRELRMNMSKEKMIDLVKAKKKNVLHTAANEMSRECYADGSVSGGVQGLANIIQANGQGTVGGIDASVWAFWRNQFLEMTGTNLAATPNAANAISLKADMNKLWLACDYGNDTPDIIAATHDMYALYEIGEQQLQRYMDEELASAGFTNLKYKSASVVADRNVNFAINAEKMYFINTDHLYLFQHPEAQWTADDEKRPTNQDAVVIPYYWMGNFATDSRRTQGVLFDAA
jgi:hypothetical protein